MDERVQHWLKMASQERFEPRKTGKLGFMTTEDRYYDVLTEITALRTALGEACDVIKSLERQIERNGIKEVLKNGRGF